MKILIIKPSSLGDVIHSLPFLKAVKETFPDAHIEWVISKNLKGIIEENPLINELIVIDKDSWKSVKNLPETLRELSILRKTLSSKHYDIVVDLQGLLRSGLITFFTKAPLKIGFANAREGSRLFYDKKVSVNGVLHAVDKCLEVAMAVGAKISSVPSEDSRRRLTERRNGRISDKVEFPLYIDNTAREKIKELVGGINEYIVMVPSARWHTKRWPVEYFALLATRLSLPCVITGTNADREIIEKIIEVRNQKSEHRQQIRDNRQWTTDNGQQTTEPITQNPEGRGKIINLCGKTDLKELLALIAGAKAVVSNDSGPMHIAAALNVPVIALFGPTDSEKTGPYGWQKKKNLKVLRASVPCSPCFKKKCKEPVCMSNISVETVLDELKEYL